MINGLDNGEPTMHTALCVIPPEEAWDTIQRARYLARDMTYRKWPPAIRLFHPFCPHARVEDAALEVANLIEKYKIRPFKVVLNSFAIVPQLEAIEADLEMIRSLPAQQQLPGDDKRSEDEKLFQQLIQTEERIGRLRFERRKKQNASDEDQELNSAFPEEIKASPRGQLQKQKKMYEEFNGPCMVCLEPDPKSREALEELRDLLLQKLFKAYDKFSPTSSIAITGSLPKSVLLGDSAYRPLVPIAGFSSVTSAVKFAKKIKGLWKPLTFTVTDLQFISDVSGDDEPEIPWGSGKEDMLTKSAVKDPTREETFELTDQFGCDAAVMLIGEEIEQDQGANEIMLDFLVREGTPGGGDTTQRGVLEPRLSRSNDSGKASVDMDAVEDLLAWLDDDADSDEGTIVVIGRTHFFSGEMRCYDG
jgi:hypothetical protein